MSMAWSGTVPLMMARWLGMLGMTVRSPAKLDGTCTSPSAVTGRQGGRRKGVDGDHRFHPRQQEPVALPARLGRDMS